MKLFDFFYEEDFGHDVYFTVGQFRNFNILDGQIHTSEYWSWEPNIRFGISIFDGSVFSLNFHISSLSLDIDFLNYRCPMNLSHTREL
jgi:hypothetical protein